MSHHNKLGKDWLHVGGRRAELFFRDHPVQLQLWTSDVHSDLPGSCPLDHMWFGVENISTFGNVCFDVVGDEYWVYFNGITSKFRSLPDALRAMADFLDQPELKRSKG